MKFYRDINSCYYWFKIKSNNLDAIYYGHSVLFLKNGECHNAKNAAAIHSNGYKVFYLNGKLYGYQTIFTKKTWRKFVKLKAFI
jgi:hypothetical protein